MKYVATANELEQIIKDIQSSHLAMRIEEIKLKDFAGKDSLKSRNLMHSLKCSLTAAKGYESHGVDYNVERAYSLDRSAKCIDFLLDGNKKSPEIFRLYAGFKEQAGDLFKESAKKSSNFYEDAGYSFLWAAWGYASIGDVEKAKMLLKKSYNSFYYLGLPQPEFRRRKVIDKIKEAKKRQLHKSSNIYI